ncbi:uncharacterized protein HD556DRAFT_1309632 [Suillus plorans]|uniref:Zn(2)-C6 fungal-type domain-containing protein n=1 Tax=Suillus plorans TaxID=116603 RepID=A0A9P7ANH9_9AGAM|nr:uncharacterized protein HD556DRAFT_1309632 [Suillus plorans]KAG1792088.1 hypothetical protein HD556DRAFT_1309632 [Suillus plorans]
MQLLVDKLLLPLFHMLLLLIASPVVHCKLSIPTVGGRILGHKCMEQLWNHSWTQYCYSRSTFLHPQTTNFKKYPQPHPRKSRLVRISQKRIMTIPPAQANHALNITLATLQSLMKHCIKVKEGNPEALRLSDEIAQCMAKDLKLYGGNTTSFSLQLLSFAAVVRENSRGGAFKSVPETSVTDDDLRIKSHPRFDKTVDYLPPSSLDDLVIATTETANPTAVLAMATAIVPPSTQLASPSTPSLKDSDILAGPEPEPNVSSDLGKEKAEDPPIPINTATAPPAKFNLFMAGTKKRKAAEEDTDAMVVVAKTKLPSPSKEPVKKRKISSKSISKKEWGSDDDIATPWKHSVRYHPWQCDKCAKLDIACLVLPDKKFGYMCLACANCDSMKITCAIDSVGVRQRLQAKAAKASSDPPAQPKASKSRAVSKALVMCQSRSQQSIVQHKDSPEEEKKPLDVLPGRAQMQPEDAQSLVPTNLLEPEPTAREILQGIQDLGRRLDLLAANERVDALEVRLQTGAFLHVDPMFGDIDFKYCGFSECTSDDGLGI